MRIRISIFTTNEILRQGIVRLVAEKRSGSTNGGQRSPHLQLTSARTADVILIDGQSAGARAHLDSFATERPQKPSIILEAASQRDTVNWLSAGAFCCFPPETKWTIVKKAIRSAYGGKVDPALQTALLLAQEIQERRKDSKGMLLARLTTREMEVAQLLVDGSSDKEDKEMAATLGITISTVKNHLHNVYTKCDIHDRKLLAERIRSELQNPLDGDLDPEPNSKT